MGDYTLYQLKVLYSESLKAESEKFKRLSYCIRFSDVQALDNKAFTSYHDSI